MVAHPERKFELIDLEDYGILSVSTLTAVPPNDYPQNLEQCKIVCHFCEEPGHVIIDCRKKMKLEQEQRKNLLFQNTKTSTLKPLHLVHNDNEQIILQKSAGRVPMALLGQAVQTRQKCSRRARAEKLNPQKTYIFP